MTPFTAALGAELVVVIAIFIGAAVIVNGGAIGSILTGWVN